MSHCPVAKLCDEYTCVPDTQGGGGSTRVGRYRLPAGGFMTVCPRVLTNEDEGWENVRSGRRAAGGAGQLHRVNNQDWGSTVVGSGMECITACSGPKLVFADKTK